MLQTSTHTTCSHIPLDETDIISIHQHPKSYVFPASTEWQNLLNAVTFSIISMLMVALKSS